MAKLIFEMSRPGRKAYDLPPCDTEMRDSGSLIPVRYRRK